MRLWHKSLIPVLPRKQLLAQWRECCAIASSLATKGTPNHILVNKVLEYSFNHFYGYSILIKKEMEKRGYDVNEKTLQRLNQNIQIAVNKETFGECDCEELFEFWHDDRYFWQCYYNLQEKFDCGIVPNKEWQEVEKLAKIFRKK